MTDSPTFRMSRRQDDPAITALIEAAFPGESAAILEVVTEVLATEPGCVSLIAERSGQLIGYILLTPCRVGEARAWLLAPLAISEPERGHGIGSALVREGLAHAQEQLAGPVCVLGDPTYYGRFGFRAERGIRPPCPIPDPWTEAWQSLAIPAGAAMPSGVLEVPRAWQRPELWRD